MAVATNPLILKLRLAETDLQLTVDTDAKLVKKVASEGSGEWWVRSITSEGKLMWWQPASGASGPEEASIVVPVELGPLVANLPSPPEPPSPELDGLQQRDLDWPERAESGLETAVGSIGLAGGAVGAVIGFSQGGVAGLIGGGIAGAIFTALILSPLYYLGQGYAKLSTPPQLSDFRKASSEHESSVFQAALLHFHRERSEAIEKEEEQREQRERELLLELTKRRRRERYWRGLSPIEFEQEICQLLDAGGEFTQASVTSASGDGGIDIFARDRAGKLAGIQCKKHDAPVGPAVVRDLFGSMYHHGCDRGILISTGGWTAGVSAFAENKAIELWDMDNILELARKAFNGSD